MPQHHYRIVDVFAEERYSGNQLAVVLDADDLSTDAMQAIAREMNFSETTFVGRRRPQDTAYDVRIFTPTAEIPFAGHPTLGTASVVRQEWPTDDDIVLNLGLGPVAVSFEADETEGDSKSTAWMSPPSPTFGPPLETEHIAELVGLAPTDIDSTFPIQEVEIGIGFVLVPLLGLEPLRRANLQLLRWREHVAGGSTAIGVSLFSRESYTGSSDISARVFFEADGIREDPATGSAAGCLAGYMSKHRYLGSAEVDACIEQGYEIARPSLLFVRAIPTADDGEAAVRVGGHVVSSAAGVLA